MTYSVQSVVSDGSLTLLDLSVEYFDRAEISIFFAYNGVSQTHAWSWVGTTETKITFTPAVPNGWEVTIRRSTDISQLMHEFSTGAAFRAGTVDENFKQLLHIAQESSEGVMNTDFYANIDMHGNKISNLGPGTAPGEAVEFSQLEAFGDTLVDLNAGTLVLRNEAEGFRNQAEQQAQNSLNSANAASVSAATATTQADLAKDWAEKETASVDGSGYSAKMWAEHTGSTVNGTQYSAKHWADVAETTVTRGAYETQTFTVNPTSFALDYDPGSAKAIDVVAGGLFKTPEVDYTVEGMQLTWVNKPANGTTGFIRFLGRGNEVIYSNPGCIDRIGATDDVFIPKDRQAVFYDRIICDGSMTAFGRVINI